MSECDEVWSLIGKKQKRVRPEDNQLIGDCFVFVGIERHSKLVLNIAIGRRDQQTTDVFVEGLRHATSGKFPNTTDGFVPYRSAMTDAPRRAYRLCATHQGLQGFPGR